MGKLNKILAKKETDQIDNYCTNLVFMTLFNKLVIILICKRK